MVSKLTRLTIRWFEAPDDDFLDFQGDLIWHLEESGNTPEQIKYWMGYSPETGALEDETLAEVIKTEAVLAKMQGLIRFD